MSTRPADPPSPPLALQPRQVGGRLNAQTLLDGPGFNLLRFVVDAMMLGLAVGAALFGAGRAGVPASGQWSLAAFPPLALLMLYLRGMYSTKLRVLILDGIAPVVGAISIAAMAVVALEVFSQDSRPGPLVARAWLFSLVYVGAARIVLALTQQRARRRGVLAKPTLIVGAGVIGAQVARRLDEVPDYGLQPVGFLDANPPTDVDVGDRRAPVLGAPSELARVATETGASHVILAFTQASDRGLIPLVRQCDALGLQVALVPRLFDSLNERLALEHLGGLPLHGLRSVNPRGWQFAIKHALDRVGAALMLAFLAPLMVTVAVAVRLSSPGPVFFRQPRIGLDDREFAMLKFRTMSGLPEREGEADAAWAAQALGEVHKPQVDEPGSPAPAADRTTPLGGILRATSVDELPQLFNVLRGEMSLVGPRPERASYVRAFENHVYRYGDRHRVKSGLTGWAQVHGYRGQTSLADRVEWDNFYIENWSLWLDVKIMLMTVMAVVRHRG